MVKYDIAASMNGIMTSPTYQAVFAKPQFNKTAAKKDDKNDKKDEDKKSKGKPEKAEEKGKGKAEKKVDEKGKDKGKDKADKPEVKKDKGDVKDGKKDKKEEKKEEKVKKDKKEEKGKCCKKASQYQACVMGLARISEILDDVGLEKEAIYTLLALNGLVKSAQASNVINLPEEIITPDDEDVINLPEVVITPNDVDDANVINLPEEIITPDDEDVINLPEEIITQNDEDDNALFSIPATKDEEGGEDAIEFLGGEPLDFPLGEQWLAELDEEELDPKNSPMARMMRQLEEKKKNKDEDEEEALMESDDPDELEDLEDFIESVAGKKLTSLQKLALELRETRSFLAVKAAGEKDPKAKVRNKPDAVFGDKHPKVKDDKDHFPIDTIGRARNALARVQQYSSVPPWWKGSLEELKKAVSRAVKKKYPSINVGGKKKD